MDIIGDHDRIQRIRYLARINCRRITALVYDLSQEEPALHQ
jgi:hypothetical protein